MKIGKILTTCIMVAAMGSAFAAKPISIKVGDN